MNLNKITQLVSAGIIFLTSCAKVEPIEIEINRQNQYGKNASEYKERPHGKTLTWFENWTTNGAKDSYLSHLPDSLDIAVVTVPTESINNRQKIDLRHAKEKYHLLLFLPFNATTAIEQVTEQLDEVFDIVVERHPELDEDKPEDLEKLKQLVIAEELKIKENFEKKINHQLLETVKKVKSIEFDGISVQVNSIPDEFIKNTIIKGIKYIKKENLQIILEGNYKPFITIFEELDYFVNTTSEPKSFKAMNKEYASLSKIRGFIPTKFFWYVDLNKNDWKEPFSDIITSETPESRIYSIAKWKPFDHGHTGLAIREIPNTNNAILRECLQYMSYK